MSCEGVVGASAWMWAVKVTRLFTAIVLVSMLLYLSIRKHWWSGDRLQGSDNGAAVVINSHTRGSVEDASFSEGSEE